MQVAEAEGRASALRAEVASHNAAIRRHKKDRRAALDALTDLVQQCARLGIRVVIEPQRSEGAVHGPSKPPQ